jgi:hypothetical protein
MTILRISIGVAFVVLGNILVILGVYYCVRDCAHHYFATINGSAEKFSYLEAIIISGFYIIVGDLATIAGSYMVLDAMEAI